MKFWDASAVVPLPVTEPASGARERQLLDDPLLLVGWGTAVECASALQRLGREDALSTEEVAAAEARPEQLARSWVEVEPTDAVRRQAQRLRRLHRLRAADALQLAAALVACQHDPSSLSFWTADERLAAAARLEGFAIIE